MTSAERDIPLKEFYEMFHWNVTVIYLFCGQKEKNQVMFAG